MNTILYTKRFDTQGMVDVSEEFTLPDYLPEIRRVVGVKASVSSDGKYVTGEELEADGGVTYTLLYVGGDGTLAQTSETSSYTGRMRIGGEEERFTPADLILSCTAENVNCRVTSPRKITLSCRVKMHLLSEKPVDTRLRVEGNIPVRRKTETRRSAHTAEVRKSGECAGEIRERSGVKVLMAGGEVCLSDVRMSPTTGEVMIKGEGVMNVLLVTPEGEYVNAKGRAPMEETVALPEAFLGGGGTLLPTAFGNVVLLEVEAEEDGVLAWRMEYDLDCDVIRWEEAEITTDGYRTEGEDVLTFSEMAASTPGAVLNGRLTTSAAMKMKPEMAFVTAWGSGKADSCSVSGGRVLLNGSVKLTCVMAGQGEVVPEEVVIPLRYEAEAVSGCGDGEDGDFTRRCDIRVTEITARSDGDALHLTAELAITLLAMKWEPVRYLAAIAPAEGTGEWETGKNRIRLYVPDEGETAWDVEKRFRLGCEAKTEGAVYVIG